MQGRKRGSIKTRRKINERKKTEVNKCIGQIKEGTWQGRKNEDGTKQRECKV
jgi:hypothetical protein